MFDDQDHIPLVDRYDCTCDNGDDIGEGKECEDREENSDKGGRTHVDGGDASS